MDDLMPVFICLILFVGLPWIIFHYITKWKQAPRITDEDEKRLDEWESADSGLYRKTRVRVSTLLGEVVAWTYVLDAYEGGLPSASYVGILADAAAAADAPDDYVASLRNRPCRSIGH